MPLSIKVTLKSSQTKKAMPNVDVVLMFYQNRNGRIQQVQIARGRTKPNGTLTMSTNVPLGAYLPRVLLRGVINRKWQNLTALPKTYNTSLLDFGIINVNTVQTVTISNVNYSGMVVTGMPTTANANTVSAAKYKQVETQNTTLNAQLKTAKAEKNSQKVQLTTLQKQLNTEKQSKAQLAAQSKTLEANLKKANQDKQAHLLQVENMRAELLTANNRVNDLLAASAQAPAQVPAQAKVKTATLKTETVMEQAIEAVNKVDAKAKSSGRFRISKAKMSLKMLSGDKAGEVRLVSDATDFKNIRPEHLSVIDIDLSDHGTQGGSAGTSASVKMPNLVGYTQTLAMRKLEDINMSGTFYQQQLSPEQVKAQPNLVGQILKQYPLQGKVITDKNDIALIVGTYIGE